MKTYRIEFTDPGFGPFADPASKFKILEGLLNKHHGNEYIVTTLEARPYWQHYGARIETTEPARQGAAQ